LTMGEVSRAGLDRALLWHPGGLEEWTASDWGIAMAGEAGEVCNAIKKLNRLRTGAASANNPASEAEALAKVAEEIADTYLYLDLLAQRLGIDISEAVVAKFNRVSEREGFPQRL
jgi:NTP pyrophosphatase (non-canonical NTP hydrolase)